MATVSQWIEGARPRTWPAAVAPVAAGTGSAIWQLRSIGELDAGIVATVVLPRALLALAVALALQIGVNYANDYSDGIRGTDDDRVGPFRLTGSRAAAPATVKRAAIGSLAAGAVFGVVLIAVAGIWWALVVGAAAVAAAWFYTGGKKPYGYLGLGELFVFVFFGLVAVNGTAYAITLRFGWVALLASIAIGLLAVAIMLTNNLRDIPTDTVAGKRTLAVRLGDRGTRLLFAATMLLPFVLMVPVMVVQWPVALVLLALPFAIIPARTVLRGAAGRDLIPVLGASGKLELLFSLLLLAGLVL
ncbi:1,4-dihydroxy-2-naphthoate polyprenyltransferase [Brachybacterium muris]|uniref:1,4-dihydroxy-2-naphthoate octaprenyltransferase n=1 Tax=Brachybacterium muris UCD-AY4 TaxID=1249481 RepID=A0A022L1A8_9MICO|nr:1,4-dihydroxy-2-naphthoate polyprenyltransferase [Brachybacterium muris]EYT51046.1 1,4-dihydroxy-2-naphthoate prenyltransferase [Brachybacterium muris UCD-AY4]MCT1429996.1 1,4-dihydroxy-2-naphthoate polyprenyltransferase [Brachybacterium muris]MCT1654146.1 1,4-dihydroxy-2-naphthoate polyprenyltransferase [Brachybacterium muris]MCT2176496.1 1,4-dihydroxy-2-naphthoate polyprenyltransferase [Brachybacterium muris]MCT2261144.1 1,4-dihydroxy-2-naphthoate polyprenyltransferase [Brachybacterium mu